MLGPPKSRRLDDPIRVSIEELVPRDHFYRHLERGLDLAFVRDLVRETYASIGRPSIDPAVSVGRGGTQSWSSRSPPVVIGPPRPPICGGSLSRASKTASACSPR